MLNRRLLSAWPNYFVIPTMLAFWLVVGVLFAQLLGSRPYHTE